MHCIPFKFEETSKTNFKIESVDFSTQKRNEQVKEKDYTKNVCPEKISSQQFNMAILTFKDRVILNHIRFIHFYFLQFSHLTSKLNEPVFILG